MRAEPVPADGSETLLITGGAGYIGSQLVNILPDRIDVRILDDFSMSSPKNIANARRPVDVSIGDVRSRADVESAMEGVDRVVHLAARTGAGSSDEERERTFDINLEGTRTVVDAARDAGVEKFVFASTCNLYGYGRNVTEDDDPDPPNAYAESKAKGEELALELADDGVSVNCLRLATNYGFSPGVRFNLVVNLFAMRAAYGEPVSIYGDGTNWRPFIHVKDSARAYARAALTDEFPTIVNVGATAENYQIEEIAEIVEEKTESDLEVRYRPDCDPGPDYHVSFERIEDTNFELRYTLEEGIDDLLARFNAPYVPVAGKSAVIAND